MGRVQGNTNKGSYVWQVHFLVGSFIIFLFICKVVIIIIPTS